MRCSGIRRSATICSGWLHETALGRPKHSISCRFLKIVEELLGERGLEADPRQSGAGSSATLLNWRSGGAVISSQPISLGVSMRPTFVSRVVVLPLPSHRFHRRHDRLRALGVARCRLRPNACSARRWRLRRIHRPGLSIRTERVSTMSAILAVQDKDRASPMPTSPAPYKSPTRRWV